MDAEIRTSSATMVRPFAEQEDPKEYPVWLIVVLILVAVFLAQNIVSTSGCGMEAPPS